MVAPRRGVSEDSALNRELQQLNPDELTPRAALEALYRLKGLFGER